MKKLFVLTAFAAVLALTACKSGGGGGDGGGDGGGNEAMADTMMKPYLDGTAKAHYWVVVHGDPQPGQMCEWTSTTSGMKNTTSWQCCKRDGNNAWLECDMSAMGFIMAYQVDVTKKWEDGANVLKAWVAKKGGEPKEIQVTEYKKAEGGTTPDMPKSETTNGEEKISAAGMDWDCNWTNVKTDTSESKTWMSKDGGWFGGMIKSVMKGSGWESATELTKRVTNCKPWINWPA